MIRLLAGPALADDTVRLAAWNALLTRDGPGLLLRDILDGKDAQAEMAARMMAAVDADILLLNGFDYDMGLAGARAFADIVRPLGPDYRYLFALRPNSGWQTGLDVDGDGRTGGAADAQGYGEFAGQGGMVILSKYPFDRAAATDFSDFLWADLPGNLMNDSDPRALATGLRLSSVGHWSVPVILPGDRRLVLLAWHAGTPVFDGPEDRNGRRNHDENLFWVHLLNGDLPFPVPEPPFVLVGSANLDPADGAGRREAIDALLSHPKLRDPAPRSRGGKLAGTGGANDRHTGDPALDTADWRDDPGPGNLRVEYVLPSTDLDVRGAGVFWPAPDMPEFQIISGREPERSWHGIVWADIGW